MIANGQVTGDEFVYAYYHGTNSDSMLRLYKVRHI